MAKPVAVVAVRRSIKSLNDGANVYLLVLLDELRAAGFSVRLVFAPESTFGDRPFALTSKGLKERCDRIVWRKALHCGALTISLSPKIYGRFIKRIAREVRYRLRRERTPAIPGRSSQRLPDAEARALAVLVDREAPRLVVAEYSALGDVLRHVRTPSVTRAVLLHDLFSQRVSVLRAHTRTPDVAEITLEEEVANCGAADLLIYASRSEKTVFAPHLPGRAHHWLAPERPFRVNCGTAPELAADIKRAVFIGVCHGGNLDALDLLMEEIWPRVTARVPRARLDIVGEIGAALKPEWRRLQGVRAHGVVEDLSVLMGPTVVGLAPTRVASGVSIKIADYLSYGMPVLAFPAAMEGYGDRLNGAVEVVETPEKFADRLARLFTCPGRRRELAAQAKKNVLKQNDNAELARALSALAED